MFDPTGTVEVIVYEAIEVPHPGGDPKKTKVKQGKTYFESNVVGGDRLYLADLDVAQGERFGLCVKLGRHFEWHNNTTLMIIVRMDGTAVKATQYLNASDIKPKKLIDQVRARSTKGPKRRARNLSKFSWHKLKFGELEHLDTGAYQTGLPAWASNFDKDVITVHLQLGTQGETRQFNSFNHGPDAHQSKSIKLEPIGPAGPVRTSTEFFHDRREHDNSPITFKFHYTTQDDGGTSSFKAIGTQACEAGSFKSMASNMLGKRSRDEYEEDMEESSMELTPPITSKRAKQDTGGINPQWLRAKEDGYI